MAKGRVLMCKLGLDGHDRGARYVTRILMEAGFEVIYTGLRQNPEAIVQAALQEDVDLIGISILSGSHKRLLPRVTALLREHDLGDVPVVVGGIVPEQDVPALKEAGVAAVFGPGADEADIVRTVGDLAAARRRSGERTG